ncbi:MAG: ABC transporter ATP-binding protein [Methylobacter sp.]|uniref:ABC transporter ATP-binding protein n=1 Tax=Methylobacter sp. TaxID=2051955 RepID=UPI0025DFCF2C|nr:ABC transporter ATP-binding protein [Methylobacter sp.]MCK9620810.1 ABC transporter ATP-binding protein [Methylobacter sp.]
MEGPLISVSGLSKYYLENMPVLKDINFSIDSGEFVAIMGHSGSGKSTLMNILGCLDTPTGGHYYLEGRDTAALNADELALLRNRLIGFVFQGFNLLPRSSILDNIGLPLLYAGKSKAERREKALLMLDRIGLAGFGERKPNQLSGGQQQRVAIARALVTDPKLILADEPTGNLDTQTGEDIMKIFHVLNEDHNITIILVTHEADIAAHAKRLIRVVDGRIASDQPS